MKYLLPLISLILLASCCVTRQVAPAQPSVRIEYRTETVVEKDTVFLTLPPIEQSRSTLDTVSVLENKYSKSVATVSDGKLEHFLQVKPVKEPVTVEKKIVYRDSLVYVTQPGEIVEVEKKLSWWQSFKMKVGGWALILALIAIAIATIYFVLHLKSHSS